MKPKVGWGVRHARGLDYRKGRKEVWVQWDLHRLESSLKFGGREDFGGGGFRGRVFTGYGETTHELDAICSMQCTV